MPTPAGDNSCPHQPAIEGLRATLNQSLIGKQDVVELVLACLLARGHLLFDDLPGLGKTTLAKAVAQAVGRQIRSSPMHSRPVTGRCNWLQHLQPENAGV